MTQFSLFDQVQLTKPITLTGFVSNAIDASDTASVGTVGTIVEVLAPNEAFLVELFGDWVTSKNADELCRAKPEEDGAFRETIGVEIVRPDQMMLLPQKSAKEDLFHLLESMPESLLEEVQVFAKSLQHQHSNVGS